MYLFWMIFDCAIKQTAARAYLCALLLILGAVQPYLQIRWGWQFSCVAVADCERSANIQRTTHTKQRTLSHSLAATCRVHSFPMRK